MDCHGKRTIACIIGLDGRPNGSLEACIAANWAANMEGLTSKSVSPAKVAETYEAHRDVIEFVASEAKKAELKPLRRAGFVTPVSMEMAKDKKRAEAFLLRVLSGADLGKGSPELAIRNHLLKNRGGGGSAVKRDIGYTREAMQAFKKGEPLSEFTFQVASAPKKKAA